MDIKETLEIMDFLMGVVEDAADAKEGGFDVMDVIKISIGNAPAAVKAAMGADQVVNEMKDLDKEEVKLLADKGVALAKALMKLYA